MNLSARLLQLSVSVVGVLLATSRGGEVPAPPNDCFAEAAVLSGTRLTAASWNYGASAEVGEPRHGSQPASRSVWWSWTAPFSGTVELKTDRSSVDTVLVVYTGSFLALLRGVATNDNAGEWLNSRLVFQSQAGTTYSIAVDGKDGQQGSIWLWLNAEDVSTLVPLDPLGSWPGGNTGHPMVVWPAGDLAYVAQQEGGLAILDITDPAHPVRLGGIQTADRAYDVCVVGDYAYVADANQGIQVVRVTDPTRPVRVGGYACEALRVRTAGTLLYVAAGGQGLEILDISEPEHPTRVGGYASPAWVEDLDVDVANGLAYLTDPPTGMLILSVTDPAHPVQLGEYVSASGWIWAVRVVGSRAYLGLGVQGIDIVSVADRENPALLGRYSPSEALARSIDAAGDYAYVADGWGGLLILGVSDPANPVRIGSLALGGFGRGVVVRDSLAFLAASKNGVEIIDVGVPSDPVLRGAWDEAEYVQNVTARGDHAFLATEGGLAILEVSHPEAPACLARIGTPREASDVELVGGDAFVTGWWDGIVAIVDVKEPAHPKLRGSAWIGGGAQDTQVWGDYAYVASTPFTVLDVRDRTAPQPVASLELGCCSRKVSVAGDCAYLAASDSGLQIVNVAKPAAPEKAGEYATTRAANGVAAVGRLVYVATDGAMEVLEAADPTAPVRLGGLDRYGLSVEVDGRYAYVAAGFGGVLVVDVWDPKAPAVAATHPTRVHTERVHVADGRIYAADGRGGLVILANPFPTNSPPAITDLPNQRMTVREDPDDPPLTVSFDMQDADTMADYLLVSVSSSDAALLPPSAMVLEGSGVHHSLQLAPPPGALGAATVTVTVSDGRLETADTFLLEVGPPPAVQWATRQRDPVNTGRANFAVPGARLNDRFFDVLQWQKRTPGSPDVGGVSGTTMVFYDGVGPGGLDLVVGGYHWPKGVQGMDRHTGRFFWAGNPDGGELIGATSAAFSPDGRTIYVANDATPHPLMAFRSDVGPAVYWHNGEDPNPELLGPWGSPKVAADGRIFAHLWDDRPYGATDLGDRLTLTWSAQSGSCACLSGPALFESAVGMRVISGGRCGVVKAYDGASGVELWSVETGYPTDADPTVDPASGNIFLPAGFDRIGLVGLSQNGQPLWGAAARIIFAWQEGANPPQRAESAGCLSPDGSTFYFQTVSEAGDGQLYAVRTADGSVKWAYPTKSRGWEGWYSSPVVTLNGVIVVGNNENGVYFALRDLGSSAQLLDTLAVSAPGSASASATLSPDGLLYLPARLPWTQGNGDGETPSTEAENLFNAFDLTGGSGIVLDPPSGLQASIAGRRIVLSWKAVDDPGGQFAYYAIYRANSPITTVSGRTPFAAVADRLTVPFADPSVASGSTYYYAVTTISTSGGESETASTIGPILLPAAQWAMRQRDAFNTGQADFVVPDTRLNDSFFDAVRWQKRTPGSPNEGGVSSTTMVFRDGVGPGGADLVVGGYHWPKGVQGMDRHTGRLFWTGNPDGGESIGANSAAFSPDGRTVYVGNDATSHPVMAFASAVGPSVFWHNGGDANPDLLGPSSLKVAPDGRIFTHAWCDRPYGATDGGDRLSLSWSAQSATCICLGNPALFESTAGLRVISGGQCGGLLKAHDGTTGAELWAVETGYNTDADPTIDPVNGNIYLPAGFDSIALVGLTQDGEPLWGAAARVVFEWRDGDNHPQRAPSAGCLSHDGSTFYFQTVSAEGDGRLYAVQTRDGSVKWSYATESRGFGDRYSSPVVTPNGVIVVGNNENGVYYALQDAGSQPVLLDTLSTAPKGTASASATVSPDGLLYLPARLTWIQSNGDNETPSQQTENLFTAFDLTDNPAITLPPPPGLRGRQLNHAVEVAWEPVGDAGSFFSHYAVYRAIQPFSSLKEMTPLATVPDRLTTSYLDSTAENDVGYYYFVTTVTVGGLYLEQASPVGPIIPVDESDLQVVSMSRRPRFPRYQPQYTGYELTEPSGFGPYYVLAATSLGPDETPETPRWPNVGDPVTYTATIRNRGTNPWNGGVHGHWEWDGTPADLAVHEEKLPPGAIITFALTRPWDGELHDARFVLDDPDARPANNALSVGTKSVPFLTYIDESFYEGFVSTSRAYPGAVTDDLMDWLNRHMDRFNVMFAEAACDKRVHYDILELLPDTAPDPPIEVPAFGIFPFRYRGTPANPRLSGWYDSQEDIDFGLLHEMGHQLGLLDLYQMDIWPEANQVSGLTYYPWDDLMRVCSPFLSPHSALGMQRWLDQAHGYFGQYIYGLPAEMRLRILDLSGQPMPGVAVTMYQLCDRPGLGKVITPQVKAKGLTDAKGEWLLPNVPLDPTKVPPLPTGDTLRDNPFGYVDMLGRNGVLHFRFERDGQTCFAWLGIVEANVAYYQGQTAQAVFTRRWSDSGLAPSVPTLLPVGALVTDEDTPLLGVPVEAQDGDTPFADLKYTAESSDPGLIPKTGLKLERTRWGGTLDLMPAANANGEAKLTVRVTDGTSTNETQFAVKVVPVNDAPVAGPDTMQRPERGRAKIAVSQVLSNDSDVEGDPLSLGSLPSQSVGGGLLELQEGWIFYTPPAGEPAPDTFFYEVADSGGASGEGVVNVTSPDTPPGPSRNILSAARRKDGVIMLEMFGIPGRTFTILATNALDPPDWKAIGTAVAGPTGLMVLEDVEAVGVPTRFYRAVSF